MLGNAPLWDAALTCHASLQEAGVPYAVAGGVAVCLHGYQRNTVDLDLVIRHEDQAAVKTAFTAAGFLWHADVAEFRNPAGIQVQRQIPGDRAGKDSSVRLPDPQTAGITETIEGLSVLRLSKLIEAKVACGSGSLQRSHKDFADVVELIAIHQLSRSFARHLHADVRETFRQLVLAARSE
jgi:hypothetical protein